jgi:hypothetical protein
MKRFAARLVFYFLLALLQVSFFDVLFPDANSIPIVLFSVAVALSVNRGFSESLPIIVLFAAFSDLLSFERFGMGVLFSVGLSYTVSFFSRRFALEHRVFTIFFSGVLIGAVAFLFPIVSGALLAFSEYSEGNGLLWALTWHRVVLSFGMGLVVFPLLFLSIRTFEEWLSYTEAEERKLRW